MKSQISSYELSPTKHVFNVIGFTHLPLQNKQRTHNPSSCSLDEIGEQWLYIIYNFVNLLAFSLPRCYLFWRHVISLSSSLMNFSCSLKSYQQWTWNLEYTIVIAYGSHETIITNAPYVVVNFDPTIRTINVYICFHLLAHYITNNISVVQHFIPYFKKKKNIVIPLWRFSHSYYQKL